MMSKQLLTQLRERLQREAAELEDFELQKWITACQGDVGKAEWMFRKSQVYKKKMASSELLRTYQPPEVLRQFLPGGLLGHDREGRPVRIELFGKYDMAGLMRSCTLKQLEASKLFECELIKQRTAEQSKKLGRRVDGLTVVFDMEGTSTAALWKPGLDTYLHMVKVLEDNYPEMMHRLMVVNAPAILPLLWKLGRPLISDHMNQKIVFYGDDFKERLLEHIEAEQLPAFLGGLMTDPDGDPRCTSQLKQGGPVPESFHIRTDLPPFCTTVVAPGSAYVVDVAVQENSCCLNWQFKTDHHDIGLLVLQGAFSQDVEAASRDGIRGRVVDDWTRPAGEEAVVAWRRVPAGHILHEDMHLCRTPAFYKVVFDNSYSWTRQKRLHYRVWLSSGLVAPAPQNCQ